MSIQKDILDRLESFILEHGLFQKGAVLLVAYSGGADSTALLYLLNQIKKAWSLTLHALHFHHGLRAESNQELEHCREVCTAWGISLNTERLPVQAYSRDHGLSLEEAGRVLRYRSLESWKEQLGCDCVLTAHHADDVAETFMMHLFQGSSLSGLASLGPRRGDIVRPLLFCGREQILRLIDETGISCVEDSSNRDTRFRRNFIRNEVLPLIREHYPQVSQKLGQLSGIIREEELQWQIWVRDVIQNTQRQGDVLCIPGKSMAEHTDALIRRVVRQCIRDIMGQDYYPGSHDLQSIIKAARDHKGNRRIMRKSGLCVDVSYGDVLIYKENENFPLDEIYVKLSSAEKAELPGCSLRWEFRQADTFDTVRACLPARENLKVRGWRAGDRFQPEPGRHQKLQDFFTDKKVALWQRTRCIILTDPEDSLLAFYIPERGWRVSADAYVRKGQGAMMFWIEQGT